MARLLLDTNVILRLLAPDPPAHHAAAVALFERAERGEVELELKSLILAESVYVLESFYRVERRSIAIALGPLLGLPSLRVEERDVLIQAVQRYASSKLGFADCYLAAAATAAGAAIVTFDADLRKLRDVPTVDPGRA